jgi:carboxylate-amine ligase
VRVGRGRAHRLPRVPEPTLGVEWELACVDGQSGELVPVGPEVVAACGIEAVKKELLVNTVEAVTGVCRTVGEAMDDLAGTLATIRTVTDPLGVELFSAGCHPWARGEDQAVSEGDRYAELMDRTRWWGRQMVIYGVHVHVGVNSAAKVMPIVSSLLTWFPHLQALSASSPFWLGEDTGYASNRSLIFQQLLRGAAVPVPAVVGVRRVRRRPARDRRSLSLADLRWDIRRRRTSAREMRVCDGLSTLKEVAALHRA